MAEMNIDVSKKPIINISNPKTNDGIQIISPGTRNHNQLHNLDYDNSGHTGFQRELNFDDTPTAGSLNPVTSGGIKTYVDNKIAEGGGGSTITIDSALSDTSTNPVQNKVIKNALNTKQDTLTFDDTPTADSTNPVTSGGVKTALDDKLDTSDAVGQKTAKGGEIFNSATSAGNGAHAEGSSTEASGDYSHAEGAGSKASGNYSHAEGLTARATGTASHAEGMDTNALGERAHAEGMKTEAKGDASHAEGYYTIASKNYQHVQGHYNIEDTTTNGYAHIVGNGTSNNRSNAHTLDWNGNAWYQGDVKIGGTSYDDSAAKALATIDDVRPAVKNTIDTIAVNTIYDLGVQTALNITLPSGQIGDFIEFDFISGETATNLTVHSSSGLVGFDLIPGTNTIYTLYFDWGAIGYSGNTVTYGWRCNYSEYSITV